MRERSRASRCRRSAGPDHPGAANAFGIFLLRQLVSASIPDELFDSARIDGTGCFGTWWSVGVAMLRGGLAFPGIFTLIGAWNDYVWPLIGVFIIGSRHFVANIAAGALKG